MVRDRVASRTSRTGVRPRHEVWPERHLSDLDASHMADTTATPQLFARPGPRLRAARFRACQLCRLVHPVKVSGVTLAVLVSRARGDARLVPAGKQAAGPVGFIWKAHEFRLGRRMR